MFNIRDLLTRIPPPLPQNRSPPGAGGGGGPGGNGRIDGGDFPLTPPIFVNRNEENSCEETRDGKKSKHVPEMNLVRMGYSGKEQIDWAKISLPLKSDLHKLLHQRISNFINPDFIVQIGNHEYRCHLLVLQCYSSFFENMDKNTNTVDLSSNAVTGDAFESLYTWMLHLGQDSYQLLRRDNILEMFTAAQYLGVKELEEQCWAFIDNEELFSEDTAFLLYLDARRLGNTAVMELMVPRIQRFFLTLVSSKDWLELQVDEVTVFLRSNYICIHCEMEVFMSGVRWLMYDWPKRNIHLVEVMHCVRFGLIAPWQLVDIRRNPESPEFIEITKDADVQKMVEDGLAFAIIKYWYGHESHDYYHWIDLLGLTEPAGRNWAGTEKNYLAYREFLMDLENYRTNHQKSLTDKKKPKSAPSDDSCEESVEETISREIPAQQVLTVGNTQIERSGNRKTSQSYNQSNQIPPPPLPNMAEFMGRRGETNPKEKSKLQNTGNVMDEMKGYIKVNKTQNHQNTQNAKYDSGLLNCNVGFVELCDDNDNDGDNDDDYQDSSEIQMNTVTYGNWNSSNIRVDDGHNCAIDYYNCYKHKYKVNDKINKLANKIRKKQKETLALSSDDDHYKNMEKKEETVVPLRKSGSSPIVNQTSIINKAENKNCSTESNNNNQLYKSDNSKTQWKGPMSSLKTQAAIILQSKFRQYLAKKKYQKLIQEKITKQLEIAEENKRKEKEQLKKMEEDEQKKRHQEKEFVPRHKETYVFNTTMKQDETVKNKRSESKMKTIYYTGIGNDSNCLSSYPPTKAKNENAIPDVPYVVRKKSDSHSSIARPVRIGAMPAEYLLPGSLFFSNKEAVLVFGGVDPHHSFSVGHNTGKNVFRYVMNRRHWDLVDELPEPRHHHSVIFFRGRVYLIGGADPRSTSGESKSNIVGSVYSFDPVSRMWAIESPLNTPRKNFGLVACGGKLYVIGGETNNEKILGSVERYCPFRKTWEEITPLNTPRMGLAATKYRDTIWVAGGFTASKRLAITRNVEVYDQRQNTWTFNSQLRIPRGFSSLLVMNDTLYLIGGATNNIASTVSRKAISISDVDVWDDHEEEWRIHSQLNTPRHGHSVCLLGNTVLVIGGVSTVRMCALNDVEMWSMEGGNWNSGIAELPTTVSGHGSITLPPASLL